MSAAIAMRPYLPADAARCAEIFRASIDALAADDYDDEQLAAWAEQADDEKTFGARLAGGLTLVATLSGALAGFASLKGADIIEMLYVDPPNARRGIGASLLEALARLAQARGAARLTSDVSDTARPLFERQGFIAQKRNLVSLGAHWLANTTMTKILDAEKSTRPAPTKH